MRVRKSELTLLVATLAGAMSANAGMLVDRGLPTANLNNVAGADRSNVAWAYTAYTSADYWLVGDTFANTSSDPWSIDTIRLWTVGQTDAAILRGGVAGSSTMGVISDATYISGADYQGSSGSSIPMHQVDFSVDITLAPGQTYQFFLDGSGAAVGIVVPFAHASNAALSGSTQEGADNLMLYANVLGGTLDPLSVGTWTSLGNGWDKASDVNVQVFGTPVPEPSTYLAGLSALGMLGLFSWRNRK